MRPSQLRRKQALEESRRRRHAFDTDDDDEDLDFLEEYDPKEERSGSGVSKSAVIWIVMGLLVTSVLVLGVIAATRL